MKLDDDIRQLVNSIQELAKQASVQYEQEVNYICRAKITEIKYIDRNKHHTLKSRKQFLNTPLFAVWNFKAQANGTL